VFGTINKKHLDPLRTVMNTILLDLSDESRRILTESGYLYNNYLDFDHPNQTYFDFENL